MSKLDTSFNTDLNQSLEILVTPQKSPEEIEFENNENEKQELLGYLKELQTEMIAMR